RRRPHRGLCQQRGGDLRTDRVLSAGSTASSDPGAAAENAMSDARPGTPPEPWLEVTCSRNFTAWLAEQRVSLACSTYQTGKLMLFGRKPDGELAVFERTFNRCMGLWADGPTMWLSSLYQLWRFENVLVPGQLHEGYDRLYVPRVG